MTQDTFTLRPTDEYIELVQLLKVKDIAQSGGHAKIIVEEGAVKVNGEQEFRKRKKLRPGDVVELEQVSISIAAPPESN
ncbi:MAG: RNA-binding S4 domain-containing protein [Saprospiraceae bacterium]